MPRPDGTLTLAEYAALPECPGCGSKLIYCMDEKGCKRCWAVRAPERARAVEHITGLLTERIIPNPAVFENA